MKKLIVLILVNFTLAACSQKEQDSQLEQQPQTPQKTMQWKESRPKIIRNESRYRMNIVGVDSVACIKYAGSILTQFEFLPEGNLLNKDFHSYGRDLVLTFLNLEKDIYANDALDLIDSRGRYAIPIDDFVNILHHLTQLSKKGHKFLADEEREDEEDKGYTHWYDWNIFLVGFPNDWEFFVNVKLENDCLRLGAFPWGPGYMPLFEKDSNIGKVGRIISY